MILQGDVMQLIDLSRPLENTEFADPPGLAPKITYFSHAETADQMLQFFPSVQVDQLPGGEGWAVEQITLSTHNGTHLDAPYHFHSTMDGGERAITIDEVPLEWCIGRDELANGTGDAGLWYRRMELGRALCPHSQKS